MTADRYFLEIPVYRCSRAKHANEMERARQQYAARSGCSAASRPRLDQHFNERYFTEWDYNEVVGWIRLFWLGPQLRAEYFLAAGERYRRAQHCKFERCDKLFEMEMPEDASDAYIQTELRTAIQDAFKAAHLTRLVVDLTAFDNLAGYVNWRALMQSRRG